MQADVFGAVKASTKLQGMELDMRVHDILAKIHGNFPTHVST